MPGSSFVAPAERSPVDSNPPRSSDTGPPSLPSYSLLQPAHSEHWRIHDRTHLELLVDYPVSGGDRLKKFVWEAYFFLPRSLKLDANSYPKDAIYRDFQSYIRFAAAEPSIDELRELPARWSARTFDDRQRAMLALRLYGCQFRVAALRGRERLLRYLEQGSDPYLSKRLQEFTSGIFDALEAFRATTRPAKASTAAAVVRHVDEDISRVVEEVFSTLCARFRQADAEELATAAERVALQEAHYRAGSEPPSRNSRSWIDEAEFRRHALKRFTSSILWISRDISAAGTWVRQVLFAVAASVAMVFAVLAAFYYGAQGPARMGSAGIWILLVAAAYALKDRIKATLQSVFSDWIARRFADRRWKLTYVDCRRRVGVVEERSGFVSPKSVPESVEQARASEHDETQDREVTDVAHPDRILSHRKDVTLRSHEIARLGRPFAAVTEVFRLDVSPWLVHTDDPKQRVYFADLERNAVATGFARRIYHVDVVYRIRALQDQNAPWLRCRVVLNRNGIRSAQMRPNRQPG